MPEALKVQESLGSILMKGSKTIGKTGALEAVKILFSEGVKMIS
jgi:Mg-chelatase subunit ChlI